MTEHREPNMVKWVGVRPGHNGEQIAKSNTVAGDTAIVHTVNAGKTFFLCYYDFIYSTRTADISGSLFVRNVADALVYTLSVGRINTTLYSMSAQSGLIIPIEIPTGFDICIISAGATTPVYAFIHGWEE